MIKNRTIHTFGDSHCNGAFGSMKCINLNHIGPVLCYSFGKEKLDRLNIKNYNVKDNDICIFSFGEIDCRCHIGKHITENKDYKNIIDSIIMDYFIAIDTNIKQFNNLTVFVYNILPVPQIHNTWNDNGFPFVGTDEERKEYVKYFNQKIELFCSIYKYNFFNIYDKYIDSNGYLNKKYSDGHVHIANNKNKFIKYFLLKSKKLTIFEKINLLF